MISCANNIAKANFIILFSVFAYLKLGTDTVTLSAFSKKTVIQLEVKLIFYLMKCSILNFK